MLVCSVEINKEVNRKSLVPGCWTSAMRAHLWASTCADSKERHEQWRERSAAYCASNFPCLQLRGPKYPPAAKGTKIPKIVTFWPNPSTGLQQTVRAKQPLLDMITAKTVACQITMQLLNINLRLSYISLIEKNSAGTVHSNQRALVISITASTYL